MDLKEGNQLRASFAIPVVLETRGIGIALRTGKTEDRNVLSEANFKH